MAITTYSLPPDRADEFHRLLTQLVTQQYGANFASWIGITIPPVVSGEYFNVRVWRRGEEHSLPDFTSSCMIAPGVAEIHRTAACEGMIRLYDRYINSTTPQANFERAPEPRTGAPQRGLTATQALNIREEISRAVAHEYGPGFLEWLVIEIQSFIGIADSDSYGVKVRQRNAVSQAPTFVRAHPHNAPTHIVAMDTVNCIGMRDLYHQFRASARGDEAAQFRTAGIIPNVDVDVGMYIHQPTLNARTMTGAQTATTTFGIPVFNTAVDIERSLHTAAPAFAAQDFVAQGAQIRGSSANFQSSVNFKDDWIDGLLKALQDRITVETKLAFDGEDLSIETRLVFELADGKSIMTDSTYEFVNLEDLKND